jgi:pantothenate kinase-related protein Tda10
MPPPAVEIDSCVVGAWTVTAHRETVSIPRFDEVEFSAAGQRWQLSADGTDYGAGTAFTATAK